MSTQDTPKPFTVFDSLGGYTDKPKTGTGTPIGNHSWPSWKWRDGDDHSDKLPVLLGRSQWDVNLKRLAYTVQAYDAGESRHTPVNFSERKYDGERPISRPNPARAAQVHCLDWEVTPHSLNLSDKALAAVDKTMADVIMFVRRVSQDRVPVGLYRQLPPRTYWGHNGNAEQLEDAQQAATFYRTSKLNEAVTAYFPSLYTFYDEEVGWARYAKGTMELLRIIDPDHTKPVYAYIWPRYHNGASPPEIRETPLDLEYWKFQIALLKELGLDGVVLWDWGGNRGEIPYRNIAPLVEYAVSKQIPQSAPEPNKNRAPTAKEG